MGNQEADLTVLNRLSGPNEMWVSRKKAMEFALKIFWLAFLYPTVQLKINKPN